ncbi:uncharacterized protein LOC134715226 [Mytilus trossulus]|uniref:uncharacterized protein LOC134715226 n=1 Tax=Mytilus trossulus TaxID=6551 RepID=UPI003005395F
MKRTNKQELLKEIRNADGRPQAIGDNSSQEMQRNAMGMSQAMGDNYKQEMQRNAMGMSQAMGDNYNQEELIRRNAMGMSQAMGDNNNQEELRNARGMSQAMGDNNRRQSKPIKSKSEPAKKKIASLPPNMALDVMKPEQEEAYDSDSEEDMYELATENKSEEDMYELATENMSKMSVKSKKKIAPQVKKVPPPPPPPPPQVEAGYMPQVEAESYMNNDSDEEYPKQKFSNKKQLLAKTKQKKSKPEPARIVPPKITADMLSQVKLKAPPGEKIDKDTLVKISSTEVLTLFDKRDYFPLSSFIETINQNTLFGDCQNIVNLSLTGIEQVTDLLFYQMMLYTELPNLALLNVSGCPYVTDSGIKWCVQQYPYLSEVYMKGCENITERTLHYLLDPSWNVIEYLDMTSTGLSMIPGKMCNMVANIGAIGCPLISPATEIYRTKRRSALTETPLKDLPVYKIVVLKDKNCHHSFYEIVTKKPLTERYLNIYKDYRVDPQDPYVYNIYEVEIGMGLENLVLSNGCIVILPYTNINPETVNKLTNQLVHLLSKYPECIFVIADLSDTGGKTSASMTREVVSNLAVWSEKFGAEQTAPLADLYMDFTFPHQQNLVKALNLIESIHQIQKNKDSPYKCVWDVDMSGGKSNSTTLKILNKAITSLRTIFPWHGNTYHSMLPDWVQKTFGKSKIRLGHLIEILKTSSDSMKFNMNSRAGGPYRELDKLFELRHLRGESIYFPKMKNKPCFIDLLAGSDFCNKSSTKLLNPVKKAPVAGLGLTYPCFSRQDIHDFLVGTQEENDIFIKVLEENYTIVKLPIVHKHPVIKDPTVYVVSENLPEKPHLPTEHFWDGKLIDQLYSGRKYRVPVLPDELLPSVISHFVKVAKICLIWKDGIIMQQGPITYMLEIIRSGDYPGVLIEGKLHSKAKPGDETYLEADRMVWKGLRGITTVFESVLMNDNIYFTGEYFYYDEKNKFDRTDALEWFAGVRERPYMCDSVQKLVPNHATLEMEQGTRCYQCDNCVTKSFECEHNLSTYRYRNECGCKEYAPLCKTCGMCSTCVNTIGKAVSTVQPSFRMTRDTNIDKLNVTGSIISYGGNNLEYIFRSDMSYEAFSHIKIVLLRGINYKIELTSIEDGNSVEMIRYQTLEGKIEKIAISGKEQQVKDTKKERPLECHSGYIIELHIPRFDLFEIHQNGRVIYSWELQGPFIQIAVTANDPGNIMISSNHYVDFQDRSSQTETSCCEMSLPSCVERKLTSEFLRASTFMFAEAKDFSGCLGCILPEGVTEIDLTNPSNQILNNNRLLMPLCMTKNRFADDWYLQKMVHMVNSPGFPVSKDDKSMTIIGMACNGFLAHYPYLHIPDNFQRYLQVTKDQMDVNLIEKGIHEIIRLFAMDMMLELGLQYTFNGQLPAQIRKLFVNTLEPLICDSEKSALIATESILMEGKLLHLCQGHKAAYQSRADFVELSPIEFGGYSRFIRDLKIVKSGLVSIPEDFFTSMPYLIRAEFYENLLEKLPDSIGTCKLLQKLDVADNNLSDLPESLVNCTELDRLDIGCNVMEALPKVVTKLKLKRLMMNNMLLTTLPENIGDMEPLEMLYASGNCFTNLPKSIGKLKNLMDLSLGGVQWFELKEGIYVNKQMFNDFLSSSRIGPWLAAHNEDKMKLFQNFDLDANNVLDHKEMGNVNATLFNIFPRFGYKGKEPPEDDAPSGFPEEIFELTNLRYLNLQYQGIVHVPEGIEKLSNLETLVLSYNPNMLSVAGQCGMLPLKRLDLSYCTLLKTPPKEIRDRGFNTIYAYLRRLMTGSVECKRTKLMFVGLGGAGKTSLAKALMTNEFQTSLTGAQAITDGIDICTWTVNHDGEKVQYSVWDFAGQTVYYNTHQFFLSDRAVYLLLWNVRLGQEHAGLNFWLSSISVHASKAPIFIVGTHMDQVPKAEIPMEEMMATYPQIEGFFFVSSFTGQGIEELKSNLLKVTLKQDYMGEKIPAAYLDMENIILRKRQEDVNLIAYGEVERMANISGIVEKEEVAQAVQFLHDLGSVQHFSNEVLKSKVVINPQWIVDVMAKVVSVKESPIQEGKLKHEDIGKVWKGYPIDIHFWLLQLTEEYDLTFKLTNEKVNLVPCLLPEKKPEIPWPEIKKESDYKETKMLYHFEYLPAGLFNRAQVRLQEFSDSAIIWKRGSFLRKNEHIALLHQNKDTEMVVKVQGPRPENILFLVHEVFEALINESFHGVRYDFSVPCPDCNNLMKRDPHMFTASMIRRALDLQAPFLQCLKYFHTISVGDLQSIMPPDTTQDYDIHLAHAVNDLMEFEQGKTLDIFISYCELDAPKDKSNVIHPEDVKQELLKENYKCYYPEAGKKYSTDLMAKSLIDSSIFVAFISNNYVSDQTCCNMFKFAKTTLRKPFILVAVGPDHEWKKSALGLLVSDVVFVNMIDSKKSVFTNKMEELLLKVKEIYSVEVSNESPPCFISYCWKNSKDAVELGTKSEPQAYAYTPDPRDMASFLTASGVPCWLDTKRIGFGMSGLLDDIAKGLLNSQMMIAFVSDDYTSSNNSMTELNFAALTLHIPIIFAIVGQGDNWKKSEANMLAFRQNYQVIDFRQVAENEAKEKLLELASGYLKLEQSESTSKKGDLNRTESRKKKNKESTDKKDNLSFQELYELAQRKFHHQITQYALTQDTGLPYPRLFIVDVQKEKENTTEKDEEKKNLEDLEISFRDGKYCVHILCECESGWHAVGDPIPLEDDFGMSLLTYYAPYLTRITALMKHNQHFKMNALSDKYGVAYLRYLAESSAVELSECKTEYWKLREKVMNMDTEQQMGGLSRCRLPSGKTIWLCQGHISKMKVTVLTKEMIAHDKTTTGVIGVDHMVESLREMDPLKMNIAFKSSKKAKRNRTAPKDAKEQVNIQKKQSLLRQKSLINDELLAEYKERMNKAEDKEKQTKVSTPRQADSSDSKTLPSVIEEKKNADSAVNNTSDKSKDDVGPSTSGVDAKSQKAKQPMQSTSAGGKSTQNSQVTGPEIKRPLSDNSKASQAAKVDKEPQTLGKMGRSKSKACSVM